MTEQQLEDSANSSANDLSGNIKKDSKTGQLLEKLHQAEASIRQAGDRMSHLHYWWKQHLFRLSCIVFLLCFYQARKPTEECIHSIKSVNHSQMELTVSGWDAARFLVRDSIVEILGLLIMASLALFLNYHNNSTPHPHHSQTSSMTAVMSTSHRFNRSFLIDRHYMIATALVTMQISGYFQNEKNLGCRLQLTRYLEDGNHHHDYETLQSQLDQHFNSIRPVPETRPFPISLIFYTIVSICCWFMQYQAKRNASGLEQVMRMKVMLQKAEQQHQHQSNVQTRSHDGKKKKEK